MTNNRGLALALLSLLMALLLASVAAVDIDVLPLRLDNPTPDGSGVKFFRLTADPNDSDASALGGFKIISQSLGPSGQAFKLWNAAGNNCNGAVLANNDIVPADGKVCFWADTSVTSKFESFLTYVALDGSANAGTTAQKVVVVTYDVQKCPTIPDLGESGFTTVPPSPTVNITLSGLEIRFEVTVAYVRNQTSWMVDFFNFDSSAGAHSANGAGRTCANHLPANYGTLDFSQWWGSQPRANFDSSVDASVTDALGAAALPNLVMTGTKWTATNIGCDKIKFIAVVPTVNLIATGVDDCTAPGVSTPAATASGLNYTANLFVFALRPKDVTNSAAGYYKASFVYPFSFRLQQTVTDIRSTSSKWAFAVGVDDLLITRGTELELVLETRISAPGLNSPNILVTAFSLAAGYPNEAERTTASKLPVLTRESDNGHCGTGETVACVIVWKMVLPELTQAQAGGTQSLYNQQYIGTYAFRWTTVDGDELAANFVINAVASDPTDVGQINVPSAIRFFRTEANMLTTTSTGIASPTFTSGEKVWVRHDFLVDSADVAAYRFTLQRAWVCWSSVSEFVPSVAGTATGCSADVAGVMEARLGQRVMLYNVSETTNSGKIVDVVAPAGSIQKSRIYDLEVVAPTDAAWSGRSVQNGFGLNALPLVVDASIRTYYFHLVSEVSQSPLKRGLAGRAMTKEVHTIIAPGTNNGLRRRAVVTASSGTGLSSISIAADSSPSSGTALTSWIDLLLLN